MSDIWGNKPLTMAQIRKITKRAAQFGMVLSVPAVLAGYGVDKKAFRNILDSSENAEKTEDVDDYQPRNLLGKGIENQLSRCEDKIVAVIAYTEYFKGDSYMSGVPTNGYGNTYIHDGKGGSRKVGNNERPITIKEADLNTRRHLRKGAFQKVRKSLKRELTDNQLVAVCATIYAAGENASRVSALFEAINSGKSDLECALHINDHIQDGKNSEFPGLGKGNWVRIALFCDKLKVEQLYGLSPASVYDAGLGDYYRQNRDGSCNFDAPRLDDRTVSNFLRRGKSSQANLFSILDGNLALRLKKNSTIKLAVNDGKLSQAYPDNEGRYNLYHARSMNRISL